MDRQARRVSPIREKEIVTARGREEECLLGLGWRAWKAGSVSGRSCIRSVLVKAVRFAVRLVRGSKKGSNEIVPAVTLSVSMGISFGAVKTNLSHKT